MGNIHFFQDILVDIATKGEQSVIEALQALNAKPEVHRVPLFSELVDIVYTFDEQTYLLVKFDFLPGETYDDRLAWLADEQPFNDEKPLYFSESSHRVSPAYKLYRAKQLFQQLHPGANVCLLLVCNYEILNPDDMDEDWTKWGLKVVYRVKDTSHPVFHPTEADAKENPCLTYLPPQDEEEEDCDEEEINAEQEEDEDNEELGGAQEEDSEEEIDDEQEDNQADDDNDTNDRYIPWQEEDESLPGHWMTQEVRLHPCTEYHDEETDESLWSIASTKSYKAFNLRYLDTIGVTIKGYYSKKRLVNKQITLNLYNEVGQLLEHWTGDITTKSGYNCLPFDVYPVFNCKHQFVWSKGHYVIEIKHEDLLLYTATFSIGNKNIEGPVLGGSEAENQADTPIAQLNKMIGLTQVKAQIASYQRMMNLNKLRKKSALAPSAIPLHAIFMGNPGTGKTTVARIYGQMLKELELLSSGHVVFKERKDLLGPYYGNEEDFIRKALDEARGGVLFIDEAYSLYRPNEPKDPGKNVIAALLSTMSDPHADTAIVLAGYTKGMTELLSMNQGLASRIPVHNRYYFEDYTPQELMQIADAYFEQKKYFLTREAHEVLLRKIHHDYQVRDDKFGNGRYVINLITTEIIKNMANRVDKIPNPSLPQLMLIEKEDIPTHMLKDYQTAMHNLHELIGLKSLKQSIESHVNLVKILMLRNEQGINTPLPPMHMVFTGNPGTGKTTVASFIGDIYASLGILSRGDVVCVERKDLVGQYIGETEQKTAEILKRAEGNVLFIDEAYTLASSQNDDKDFGKRALEVLLTTLSKERVDMLVIMAGYPNEMQRMLESNPGLKSRMPYTFHFPDYTTEELMQIADQVVKKMGYVFSASARKELEKVVAEKLEQKDEHWGNARFITRFVSAQILPEMSNRLSTLSPEKVKSRKRLCTICKEDIQAANHNSQEESRMFNEKAISRALKKLDALVGLEDVKQNIHNFVKVARFMHAHGHSYTDSEPLRWNFTGNTGTGKSTIAKIMGELLKAMNILQKGHVVEVRAEQLYNSTTLQVEEILQNAIKKSAQGLLYIDSDAPLFKRSESVFSSESLRFKLASKATEMPNTYALIIAEHETDQHILSRNLRQSGISSFDHTMHFADYKEEELLAILGSCLERKKLYLSAEASNHMAKYIHALYSHKKLGYANARTMSKIAHAIINTYVLRISASYSLANGKVLLEDVASFVWQEGLIKRTIGFE